MDQRPGRRRRRRPRRRDREDEAAKAAPDADDEGADAARGDAGSGTAGGGEVRVVARESNWIDVQLVGGRVGLRLAWNSTKQALVVDAVASGKRGDLERGAVLVSVDGRSVQGGTHEEALRVVKEATAARSSLEHSAEVAHLQEPPNPQSDAHFQERDGAPNLQDASHSQTLANGPTNAQALEASISAPVLRFQLPGELAPEAEDMSENDDVVDNESEADSNENDEEVDQGDIKDSGGNQSMRSPRGLEEHIARALETTMRTQRVLLWQPGRGLLAFPRATRCKVKVQNLSIRAATRFYMGARRSAWKSVEKTSMSSALEVRIMKLDHAPAGVRKRLGWAKCFVGTFKTKQLAHRAAEEAMAKRDRGLIGIPPRPHPELCASMHQTEVLLTHLEVRVESNNLASFDYAQKQAYIWHLLRYHCEALDAFKLSESLTRICKFSYLGEHVCALPVFTCLPVHASILVKDLGLGRRPSGPQELPEKMRRRVGKDQAGVPQRRKRPATMKEMRKLVEDEGSDNEEDREHKKRFGHFFKGLSRDAQELARQEAFREEQRAIRDRTRGSANRKSRESSAGTQQSEGKGRRRAVFTTSQAANEPIQASMWAHRQRMRAAAIKLQRIFRDKAASRIARENFRAEWLALSAQRFVRGWIGRRRAEEWRVLAHSAAEHVQRFWHMVTAQRRARRFRSERERLVMLLQPRVRGMIARKILAWRKHYDWAATRIQSLMRGHRDRGLFKRMLARAFHETVVVPAAVTIQRVGRGMLDRRVARILRYEKHYAEVIVPSSIVLQNLWRQRVAKKRVAEMRARQFACTMLQRVIRGRLQRKRFTSLVEWKAQMRAATRIASVVRGWIAREIYAFRVREHVRKFVEEPAALLVQAAWRGLQARRWFRVFVMKDAAVLVLQRAWRTVLARRKAREALDEMARAYMAKLATRLQAAFRGFRGRNRFRHLAQERDAQRLWATFVVQRQWRALVRRRAKRRRREEVAREMHFLDLELVALDVEEIAQDIRDTEEERNRILQYVRKSGKYRRKLKASRKEMEYRLPELELELSKLDPEDEEMIPWQETYESEIEQLTNMLAMSEQELESKSLQTATLEEDAGQLLMEIEDLQLDMDDAQQRRATLVDEQRARELRACAEACRQDRAKRVSTQRARWTPKDVRRKIIARTRAEAIPPLPPDFLRKSRMMLGRVGTISVEKREEHRRRDAATAQRLAFERQLLEQATRGVKENALVRATFDGAVDRTKRIVQEYTYELRRPPHDIRSDPRRVCQRCGLVTIACQCDAAA